MVKGHVSGIRLEVRQTFVTTIFQTIICKGFRNATKKTSKDATMIMQISGFGFSIVSTLKVEMFDLRFFFSHDETSLHLNKIKKLFSKQRVDKSTICGESTVLSVRKIMSEHLTGSEAAEPSPIIPHFGVGLATIGWYL